MTEDRPTREPQPAKPSSVNPAELRPLADELPRAAELRRKMTAKPTTAEGWLLDAQAWLNKAISCIDQAEDIYLDTDDGRMQDCEDARQELETMEEQIALLAEQATRERDQ